MSNITELQALKYKVYGVCRHPAKRLDPATYNFRHHADLSSSHK